MAHGIDVFCEEDEEPADVCHHGLGFDVYCEDCTIEYAMEVRQDEERQHHARLMRLDAFGEER